jgi:calcineurin-like phosphoesterase
LILPKGTGFVTDLGMCGPYVSSIGRDLKPVTKRFVTGMPGRFEVADGPSVLEGAIFEFDPATKVVTSVETVRIREPYAKS